MSIIHDALKKAQAKREAELARPALKTGFSDSGRKTSSVLIVLAILVGSAVIGITGWRIITVAMKGDRTVARQEIQVTVPRQVVGKTLRSKPTRKASGADEGEKRQSRQAERYFWLGDLDGAEKSFRQELESGTGMGAELANNLGLVLRKKGDLGEAIRLFDRALEEEPDMVEALSNRAVAYRMLKRYREASADLQKALQLDPDFGHAQFNLATVHEAMGQTGKAIVFYRKYLNNSSRSPGLDEALIVQRISALEARVSSISWPGGKK